MSIGRKLLSPLIPLFALVPLLMATQVAAADTGVSLLTTMHIAVNGVNHDTTGFDISWVEQSTGRYFLADGSNDAVDRFDAGSDSFVGFVGQGNFHHLSTSACQALGASDEHDCNGPNGVVTDSQGRVWAGDGVDATDTVSSIKVMDPAPGTSIIKSIPTGGKFRSDELSYDPRDQMILIANPDFNDAFLTWIDVTHQTVAGTFHYSPSSASAWGGLEQSVFNAKTGLFYQAVPGVTDSNGHLVTPGEIDVFSPIPVNGVGQRVAVFKTPSCTNGPTGLVLAPNQTLVGACDNGGIVVQVHNGMNRTVVPNVGGADELWFNSGDGNVYFARAFTPSGPELGVINGLNDHFVTNLPSGPTAHSVAAYAANDHIFVPTSGQGIKVFVSSKH